MKLSDLVGMTELEATHAVGELDVHWDYVCFYSIARKTVWPDPKAAHLSVRVNDDGIVVEAFISVGDNEEGKL